MSFSLSKTAVCRAPADAVRLAGRLLLVTGILTLAACAGGGAPQQAPFSSVALSAIQPGAVDAIEVNQAVRMQRIMAPIVRQMNDPILLNEIYMRVLDDPTMNVAWGGGGDFYITTGLLAAATDHQLRALLAIEAAHADLNHPAGVTPPPAPPEGGIGMLEPIPANSRVLQTVRAPLVVKAYTEREERDADARAVAILRRLAYDGRATILEGLIWMEQMKDGRNAAWVATHPLTPARIKALEAVPEPARAPTRTRGQ